jgi:HSP20 family molecular chaperone IbpA
MARLPARKHFAHERFEIIDELLKYHSFPIKHMYRPDEPARRYISDEEARTESKEEEEDLIIESKKEREILDVIMKSEKKDDTGSQARSIRLVRHLDINPIYTSLRVPLCDMIDKSKEYDLELEVPGVKNEKNIRIKASEKSIEVYVEGSEKGPKEQEKYIYRERATGPFYRKIFLPFDVDTSKPSTVLDNGVLTIIFSKVDRVKKGNETNRDVEENKSAP